MSYNEVKDNCKTILDETSYGRSESPLWWANCILSDVVDWIGVDDNKARKYTAIAKCLTMVANRS